MKNKKSICIFLLILILSLVGAAYFYTSFKADEIFSGSQTEKSENNLNGESPRDTDEGSSTNTDEPFIPSVNEQDPMSPNDETSEPGFKMITTYKDFYSYISRTNRNMFVVFGRESCYYCGKFAPVLTEVANEYRIEVLYVDIDYLSNEDYAQVINSSFSIPSKCMASGQEGRLSDGFGTPLSLFINNGQTISCIRGYKDKNNLVSLLKENKYIN